jgi:ATP-dependent Clp protease adaptor protein ClpS
VVRQACWTPASATALRTAFDDTRLDGRDVATCADLVSALLRLDELAGLERATGVVLDVLAHEDRASVNGPVLLAPPFVRMVEVSVARAAHALVDPLAMLVYAMDHDARLLADLHSAGLARGTVAAFAAHGVRALAPPSSHPLPEGDELAVVLHNDHFTTQEFVVDLLRDVAGLGDIEATQSMLTVHAAGSAVIAVLDRKRALGLADALHADAREYDMPLLVTLAAP